MFKKESIEYKICELSTKVERIENERLHSRKVYLQALHIEDLNHLKTHFNLNKKIPDQFKLPNPPNDHEACEFIEL
tara:strand:- start:682 stop:909 length:228 start_codon:yes stop_codon:yes gene_type:complete